MPTLAWPGGAIDLPELDIPYRLQAGYDACLELRRAIAAGETAGTRRAVADWPNRDPAQRRQRQMTLDIAVGFLGPRTLAEAELALAESWAAHLARDPRCRAARMVARQCLAEHPDAAWQPPPSATAWPVLSSWLAG